MLQEAKSKTNKKLDDEWLRGHRLNDARHVQIQPLLRAVV